MLLCSTLALYSIFVPVTTDSVSYPVYSTYTRPHTRPFTTNGLLLMEASLLGHIDTGCSTKIPFSMNTKLIANRVRATITVRNLEIRGITVSYLGLLGQLCQFCALKRSVRLSARRIALFSSLLQSTLVLNRVPRAANMVYAVTATRLASLRRPVVRYLRPLFIDLFLCCMTKCSSTPVSG